MKNRRSAKKKGGKKKKEKQQASAASHNRNETTPPPAPIKLTRCLHGKPEGYIEDVGKDMLDAFLEEWFASTDNMNNGLTAMRKLSPVYHTVMEHPDTAQLLYGLSASHVLLESPDSFSPAPFDESMRKAFKSFLLAVYMDKCKIPLSVPKSEEEIVQDVARVNWCFVKHSGSFHDVITYIDKKIPCNCLAEIKQKALEKPELRKCSYCHKKTTKTMWCEDCLCVEYCSKECQLAQWPDHQKLCNLFSGKINAGDYFILHPLDDDASTAETDSNGKNKIKNTA